MEINTLAAFRASSTKWHVNIAQGRNHGRNLVCIPVFSPPKSLPKEKKTYKTKWFIGAVLSWSHPTRSRKNQRKITEPSASWWFFTNPSEKYATVKLDHFPKHSGWKFQNIRVGNLGTLPVWDLALTICPPKKISGNLRELSRKIREA